MRYSVILITICLFFACSPPHYSDPGPNQITIFARPQLGYTIKRVIERLPPATLVGDDGSVCRTSAERFVTTKVNSWAACNWMLPALDSTEIAQAGF